VPIDPMAGYWAAMSREDVEAVGRAPNIELVLRLYDAFNRRDEDALVGLYDERIEIVSFAAAVEGSPNYRGHEGVREWYRNLVSTFAMTTEPGEFLPYRRFVLSIPRVHIRAGDDAMTYEQGILYEVRDRRIARSLGYKDAGTALVTMGQMLLGAGSAE
jgi:ketosteroid isomerase-like protein